jgi:hypothetical protein
MSLRGFMNERNDFTYAWQGIADLASNSPPTDPVVMAHFADGLNWATQVLLVNPSDMEISGTIEFYDSGDDVTPGAPVTLTLNGQTAQSFPYDIQPHAAAKFDTSGDGSVVQVGSVHITPDLGSITPAGYNLFSYRQDGVMVSQSSVSAQIPGSAFRVYVESIDADESGLPVRSGVAIANSSPDPITVQLEVLPLSSSDVNPIQTIDLPGYGHVSKFLEELVPDVVLPDRAILRITSTSGAVVALGLRLRINERGELLTSTIPTTDEAPTQLNGTLIFPQVVAQDGYSTQFVVLSTTDSETQTGIIDFFDNLGTPVDIKFKKMN